MVNPSSMKGSTLIDPEQFIPIDAPSPNDPVGEDGTLQLNLASDLGEYRMKSMFHPYFSFHQVEAGLKYNVTMKPAELPRKRIGLVFLSEGKTGATFGDHDVNVTGGAGGLLLQSRYERVLPALSE